ncbi:hypothetical protein ACFXTH_034701 [Malus domestica]
MSAAVGAISATKGDDGHSDEVDLDEEDDEVAALESEKDQPSLSSSLPLFRIFNLKKHREGVKVKKTKSSREALSSPILPIFFDLY